MTADHEPTFCADHGPRYHHAPAGSGAHEVADELTTAGTAPGDPRMRAAANWRRGAVGEEAVGEQLAQLARPDWAVVHDLTIGSRGANLDHLVIGPPRCFTLNTKHLSSDVVVYGRQLYAGGRRTDYLPRAVAEAARVQGVLRDATGIDPFVWPVLVFHGSNVTIKEQPRDVTVLTTDEVLGWFRGQVRNRFLSPADVQALETAARATTTWPTPAAGFVAPPPVPEPGPRAISVVRWRKFGHDRWYVNLADGTALGYLDAADGRVVVERTEDDSLVRAVLRAEGAPMA